ncbi:MAG: hypothetical protein ACXVEX_03810 [Actinomycetota bacterium]
MMSIDGVSGGTLLLLLLVPLLFIVGAMVALGLFVRTVAGRGVEIDEIEELDERAEGPERARPWWGNPLLWVGVSAVFLVLGLLVAPHFLGGTFIFLPFIWIGRPRRFRLRRARPPDGPPDPGAR